MNSYFSKCCWRLARLFSWRRARDDEGSCLPCYARTNNSIPSRNPEPAATKSNCPDILSYMYQVALSPWQSSFGCGHIICLVTKWLTCSVFASIFDSFNRSCVFVFFKANCGVYVQKLYGLYAECLLLWAVTGIVQKRNCKKLSEPRNSQKGKLKKKEMNLNFVVSKKKSWILYYMTYI